MIIPNIVLDSYTETDLSERKVRQFTRAEDDTTSPVIVDFYKNNKVFESIEPLLTRAVKLNSSAISYIKNIKNSGEYSYFIVFVKNNDSSGTKYITSVPNYKDIDYALKMVAENMATIIGYETVSDYEYDEEDLPVYENLLAIIDIQQVDNSTLYVDEAFNVRCNVAFNSGSNDWKISNYKWNISDENSSTITVEPTGAISRNITCEVEFCLKEDSSVRQLKSIGRTFILEQIPDPARMKVTVKVSSPASVFYVNQNYTFTASLEDLVPSLANYEETVGDWEFDKIEWSIGDKINDYTMQLTPKEVAKYNIVATATYKYKRKPSTICTFTGQMSFVSKKVNN